MKLFSGSLLLRNIRSNIVAQSIPILVAFLTIPLLIEMLGQERFGFLSIAWVVVGYFGMLDLGAGRAVVRMIARRVACGSSDEILFIVWSALGVTLVLGGTATAVVWLGAPLLISRVFTITTNIQNEALLAVRILGVSVPVIIASSVVRGILEANQRFDLINRVRMPLGVANYLAPLIVATVTNHLAAVTGVIALTRICGFTALFAMSKQFVPRTQIGFQRYRQVVCELLSFGGWIAIVNLINPLLVSADRFLIGFMLPLTVVAYYTVPFEMVSRLWIIPGAVLMVLFPAFSALGNGAESHSLHLYGAATKLLAIAMFPICLGLIVFGEFFLTIWISPQFADAATPILQLLAISLYFNSLAYSPYALLQGSGNPQVLAKVLVAEALPYFGLLYVCIQGFGLYGAAFASGIRMLVEAGILVWLSGRLFKNVKRQMYRYIFIVILGSAGLGLGLCFAKFHLWKGILLEFSIYALLVWNILLSGEEKDFLKGLLMRSRGVPGPSKTL